MRPSAPAMVDTTLPGPRLLLPIPVDLGLLVHTRTCSLSRHYSPVDVSILTIGILEYLLHAVAVHINRRHTMMPVAPVAYQVILEPGMIDFVTSNPPE